MSDIVEADKDELEILEEYRATGRLAPDFFPLVTYDLVQEGYPTPNRGIMVARAWSGSDAEGRLLSGRGEFCKVEDVKRLLDESAAALRAERGAKDDWERKCYQLTQAVGLMMMACKRLKSIQREHGAEAERRRAIAPTMTNCLCPVCRIPLPDLSAEAVGKLCDEANAEFANRAPSPSPPGR